MCHAFNSFCMLILCITPSSGACTHCGSFCSTNHSCAVQIDSHIYSTFFILHLRMYICTNVYIILHSSSCNLRMIAIIYITVHVCFCVHIIFTRFMYTYVSLFIEGYPIDTITVVTIHRPLVSSLAVGTCTLVLISSFHSVIVGGGGGGGWS